MDYVPVNHENSSNVNDENSYIVKLRGLPWSATVDDIRSFLSDCQIKGGKNGIHLTMSSLGRPSGEAFVELASPEDAAVALQKDHEHMGHRYIEVFGTTQSEMDWVISHSGLNLDSIMDEGCIRMRGLPYGCTKEEVASFFSGLQIVPNGINFATDRNGPTGEAYVQFVNKENLEKALKKHMEKIGFRYIEIFRSSLVEFNTQCGPKMRPSVSVFGRMTPYNRNDRLGGPNRFRGAGDPQPFSRRPRYQDFDYWEDTGDSWSYGGGDGSVMRNKPPMRGGFRGAGDFEYGPLHRVHMRGIPFKATETDIAMFFRPLQPNSIRIICDQKNKPSGNATVIFDSHEEAVQAMSKDKEYMQYRYIELVLDSDSDYNKYSEQSGEGGLVFSPPPLFTPRRGAFRGGQIGNRARTGGPAFGYNNRGRQGRKPFMSSGSTGF